MFDFINQLEDAELGMAFTKKNEKLFEAVFSSLRDSDSNIKRTGLSIVMKLVDKFAGSQDKLALV